MCPVRHDGLIIRHDASLYKRDSVMNCAIALDEKTAQDQKGWLINPDMPVPGSYVADNNEF